MLTLLLGAALAQQMPPELIISDYFPGPWIVFMNERGGLGPEAATAMMQAKEMTEILPDRGLELCPEGAAVPSRELRRNLRTVGQALIRAGVKRKDIRNSSHCSEPTRDRPPGVNIIPARPRGS